MYSQFPELNYTEVAATKNVNIFDFSYRSKYATRICPLGMHSFILVSIYKLGLLYLKSQNFIFTEAFQVIYC